MAELGGVLEAMLAPTPFHRFLDRTGGPRYGRGHVWGHLLHKDLTGQVSTQSIPNLPSSKLRKRGTQHCRVTSSAVPHPGESLAWRHAFPQVTQGPGCSLVKAVQEPTWPRLCWPRGSPHQWLATALYKAPWGQWDQLFPLSSSASFALTAIDLRDTVSDLLTHR